MEQRARLGEVELAYEVLGEGPRLLWCHGLASCRDGDRDLIEAFAEHFTVLSYDARGHGRSSPVPDVERFSYPILAADALAMLDHVGWERAVFAGSSMGAGTVARLAAIAPERAVALVLARPGAMGEDGTAPGWLQLLFAGGAHALRTGGLDAAVAFLHSIPMARELIEEDPGRIDALLLEWGRHDPVSIAAALEGVPRTSPLEGGIDGSVIQCPTLVVPGNDVIHPAESGAAVAAMIARSRLVPPFDSLPRPDEVRGFVSLVRDFLAEHGALGSTESASRSDSLELKEG